MPLGEFSIICFGFLSEFLEKITKRSKEKNWEKKRATSPQQRAPSPRCSPTLQRGMPRRSESKGPKRLPSATL